VAEISDFWALSGGGDARKTDQGENALLFGVIAVIIGV